MSPGLCGGAHWSGDEGIAEALGAACVRRVTGCPVLGRADHPRGVGRPTVSTLDRIDFRVVAGGIRCHLGWARLIRGTLRLWRSIWSRVTSPSSGLTRWSTPPTHTLLGGGGVDGAIHRAGGPEILAECRVLRKIRYPDGLPTGESVATTGGRLPARWVIHTVGPTSAKTKDKSGLLRSCYTTSLTVADELGAATVAFPLVSSGVYGWPKDDAIR